MRIEIGAGPSRKPGYIHTDIVKLPNSHIEYLCRGNDLYFAQDGTVEEVYMQGVFEHFQYFEAITVVKECRRVLRTGGVLDFTVPDLMAACKMIAEGKLPFPDKCIQWAPERSREEGILWYGLSLLYGGQDRDGQVHQFGWTKAMVVRILTDIGFDIVAIRTDCYEPNTHYRFIARRR